MFAHVDKVIITKVFPGVSTINLNRKVGASHWDNLLESPLLQHVLLLMIQIVKVSEESFYDAALLRLLNWLCLPQMLKSKKAFGLAQRLLMELYTPEMYKVIEFMHWQPKLLNNIFFLESAAF